MDSLKKNISKHCLEFFGDSFYCYAIHCVLFWVVTGLTDENGVGQNAGPETETQVCR